MCVCAVFSRIVNSILVTTFLLITSLRVNLLHTLEFPCFSLCAPTEICDRFDMKHEMHLLHNWMNYAEKVAEVHGE